MNHAVGSVGFGGVVPIFDQHFSAMQEVVRELCEARSVDRVQCPPLSRRSMAQFGVGRLTAFVSPDTLGAVGKGLGY